MQPRPLRSSGRGPVGDRAFCSATRTATAATTWATSTAPTTDPGRRRIPGFATGTRSRCSPGASRSRAPPAPTSWRRSTKKSGPRSQQESRSGWRPPSRTRPRSPRMSTLSEPTPGFRELTLGQAVNEALAEEMRRDPAVFILGEDVAEAGTPFKVLRGLVEEFGTERVVDTPISEPGFTGIALGAAMTGMRPVVDIMFGDFLTLVMDQVANQAAKVHYMSGGRLKAPMVIRTTLGATRRSAAQHSQSLHAWVSHVPGLKVALPSTPADAKGLLKTAIRDDGPVVVFEDKMMWQLKGPVPDGEHLVPFGVADVKRPGRDVTVVATSSMVHAALEAAGVLAGEGIEAEVIDPRTTVPLDGETLVASAVRTGRCLVVDEGHRRYGVTAEIAAVIAEGAFYHLDAPVQRLGAMDVPVPFSPVLEDQTVPTAAAIAARARALDRKS